MKKIVLAALAALSVGLAGCSNPAGGLPVSVQQAGEMKEEVQKPAEETRPREQEQQQEQQQQQQEEAWPRITPADFNVDLEGFEECPKDEVYGINWVFVEKRVVDDKYWREKLFKGEDFRLKPVEFHKSNPEGVEFGHFGLGKWRPDEGAYKCVAYRKPGDAGKSLYEAGCEFHYVPDGDDGYCQTENLSVTRVASQKTKVSGGERFREVYKY